ncbi:M4 family metallopeptidase [Streptomyces sp. NA04227]|uniref:M4 family metallopeptidase n=1 Tax=Streptomyces sp. NA04227 TaxID=2742136 RepID=UPI001590787B|nr:M4 family metallopeptidase [Streptomyces sp. NA04227]QKW07965.1 M4 family metallopeptidase [Streptomyces sp. NA04227]
MRTHSRSVNKKALRATALAASATLVVLAVQSGLGTAGAAEAPASRSGQDTAAAAPFGAAQRTTAIRAAQAEVSATASKLGLGGDEKLLVRDVLKDADGTVHTRYERTYRGLPVLGGDLVTHTAKSGKLKGVNKANSARIAVTSTDAPISAAAAKKSALSAAGAADASDATTRKVIWAAKGTPVLAHESVVEGVQHDGTPSELHVITDAKTGKKLHEYESIHTGSGEGQYAGSVTLGTTPASGGGFDLTDGGRGGHKTYDLAGGSNGTGTLFHDADDAWGDGTPANKQTAGVDAAYGAGVTWDFYKSEFNRSGIRGDGQAAYSRVHYGNAYVNAFWSDSCFCMTYGDGINNQNPLTSLDVAAHEMTHGLTSATAKLTYSRESGGLNEATSDILGTSVEFYANNTKDAGDYLIGEKININGDGTPLRYMDKPSKDGKSADYWSKGLGRLNVHYSSGVGNHFFYLLSEGSGTKTINGVTYNSPTSDGSTLTGIGRDKAYKIWYRALSTYMTSNTDYAGARTTTLQAAADLYGANSAEQKAVAAAWTAVNVK